MSGHRYQSAAERFELAFIPEPNSGCWLWLGATRGPADNLRPVFMVDGKNISAYRFSFQQSFGLIPDGKMIRHRCHNSLCVNPDHLQPGTALENTGDMMRAGRHFTQGRNPAAHKALKLRASQKRPPKKFCRNGHAMTPENTYEHPSGRHVCKACKRQFKLNFLQRQKGIVL